VRPRFLVAKEKREYYANKIYRTTGVPVEPDHVALMFQPLLLENLFGGCRLKNVLLVLGADEHQSKNELAPVVEKYNRQCDQKGKVKLLTISQTDHMMGTEPHSLQDKLRNFILGGNRISFLCKTIVQFVFNSPPRSSD